MKTWAHSYAKRLIALHDVGHLPMRDERGLILDSAPESPSICNIFLSFYQPVKAPGYVDMIFSIFFLNHVQHLHSRTRRKERIFNPILYFSHV